jgi:formylmethanofuran dehydrogenase subunit E
MKTPTYEDVVQFHGHSCPGLAIGYRMTLAALTALEAATAALAALRAARASDEELVAIGENDACGVDAVQLVAGCSFGKGNLIFRDYGKHVYTFFSRTTGRGVRVLGHRRGMPEGLEDDREGRIRWILTAPEADVVSCQEATVDEPPTARVFHSVPCAACGEPVMETRLREVNGRFFCIPCAEARPSLRADTLGRSAGPA